MAQWTQTLEPYIRVHETVKTLGLNPTAGESLIIGVTLISDAGPATPTLISGQKEFLRTYTSQDLSKEYIESLNNLYTGDDKTLASTMWANAYRLAGSNTLLVTRASKAEGMYFAKPLVKGDQNTYILKDGALLKQVSPFKIVLDSNLDDANHSSDGWNINISGVGIFGNRTTDDGAQYDYYVNSLPELVEQLNETSKFFSPDYHFFSDEKCENEVIVDMDDYASKQSVIAVRFDEVYLGFEILDKTDIRTEKLVPASDDEYSEEDTPIVPPTPDEPTPDEPTPDDPTEPIDGGDDSGDTEPIVEPTEDDSNDEDIPVIPNNEGFLYLIIAEPDWTSDNIDQKTIDLNDTAYSGFEAAEYYATNVYNSATDLKVRIRRFNHDAVMTKELAASEIAALTENGKSPYVVLTSVLDTFTKNGSEEPKENITSRDFYEVAVWDPSTSNTTSFFNIGSLLGRGDMEASELNSLLSMIQVNLPDDMHDLGLNYYGYKTDDKIWKLMEGDDIEPTIEGTFTSVSELYELTNVPDLSIAKVINSEGEFFYKYQDNGETQFWCDLTIDPTEYKILSVSDSDLKKALDLIALDEVYTTEGLSDLGNTELSFQNYMANMAINDNYFYPISTVNSTNYMTIGNSATKLSQDSYKLYMSAPWDIDTGTLGWKFYASPSVLYWEAVARNRRNNNEFGSLFGQNYGIVQYQRPVTEFNKKTRQLLLSKRVNTAMWNIATQAWNMNDCYTKQNENTIMSEDGNSRLMLRISKAMPTVLRQFIGRKITEKLCDEVKSVIDYFFRTVIIPMNVTVDAYQIFCNYDEILARQNKIKVVINCRYARSLKFIEVYNNAFDVGMDINYEE